MLWAPTFRACIGAFEFQRGKEEVGMVAFICLPSVSVCFLVPRSVLGLCFNETLTFVAEMSIDQDQRVSVLAPSLSNYQVPTPYMLGCTLNSLQNFGGSVPLGFLK